IGRQILGPINGLHCVVELLRRSDRGFKDRLENANGGPQPEVGFVEKRLISREMNAAAADFDAGGAKFAQLTGQDFLYPAGTCGEIGYHLDFAAQAGSTGKSSIIIFMREILFP